MDLTSSKAGIRLIQYLCVALTVVALAMVSGCAPSEEATTQEEELAPPEEQSADQQALTSFIGEKPKEEKAEAPVPVDSAALMPPAPTMEAQLEELRTENTSLNQTIVKLEQDNRSLNARLSDSETKLMAEKDRADKAEEAAKTAGKAQGGMVRGAEAVAAAPVAVPATAYDEALQSFRGRKYDDAIAKFQALLDGGVASNLADNCTYWIGESDFAKRNYNEAIKSFERVFEYKSSEKFADSQYMIARSLQALGEKAKAKAAYEKVVKDFPTSRLVAKAKKHWASL